MRAREKFSPAQCRAARAMLRWDQEDLAQRARLEVEAIALYETGDAVLSPAEMIVLGHALNAGGVIALAAGWAGEGVRLQAPRAPRGDDPFGLLGAPMAKPGLANDN